MKNELKVVHIGEKNNDNRSYSVLQVVEEFLEELKSNEKEEWTGMFIALVGKNGGQFATGYRIANLSVSESIALLEVMRIRMLGCMNYVVNKDN